MSVTKYIAITKINFLNRLAYVADLISGSIFVGLIIFIFTNLWSVIYSSGQYGMIISGFSISMVLWYFTMTESIVTSQGKIVDEIGQQIVTGEIANHLNKPYNYIVYKYFSEMGMAIFKFLTTFLVGSVIVLLCIGPMSFNWMALPFVALSVFLAITLHFVIMAFIGIFAFWFEDSHALYFIYQKIVFSIGGMLIPLDFFPVWLGKICAFLPFSYIAYHPAKLFVQFSSELFVNTVLIQLAWIIIFILAIKLTYGFVTKKVSINGG